MGIEDFQIEIDLFNEVKLNRMLYFYYCPCFPLELCEKRNVPFFHELLRESGLTLSKQELNSILSRAVLRDNVPLLRAVTSLGAKINQHAFIEAMISYSYEVARYVYPFDSRNDDYLLRQSRRVGIERNGKDLYIHCQTVETLQFFLEKLRCTFMWTEHEFRPEKREAHELVFTHALANNLEMATHIFYEAEAYPEYDHFYGYPNRDILQWIEDTNKECLTFLLDNYEKFKRKFSEEQLQLILEKDAKLTKSNFQQVFIPRRN